MKPYAPARGRQGKYYDIRAPLRYPAGMRPSKLAAGAQYTAARAGSKAGELSRDAASIAIFGTCDPLARTNKMKRYRAEHYRQVTRWQRKPAPQGGSSDD